ncbi:DUF2806 domain-containing protein [Sphingobium yanoikuyae]|uniref:DUF2806 domain-containing protein n=1 Tax=Sphingobium yanoikuyae TaxID=13690 RepID=UPI00345E4A2E
MAEGEEGGWSLPAVVSDTVAAVPEGWRPKVTKFLAHLIGTKMPSLANEVADHIDTTAGRSLIRHELAKAAAAKAIQSPELVDRTLQRLCGDLLESQQNIEAIAAIAAEEIVADPTAPSDEDVSGDWRKKFTSYVGDISDPDMQRVWAKILAGEFRQPGSFSFRTLRIVSEIGPDVAETFAEISKLRFADNAVFVDGEEWNSGPKFMQLKLLEDWGLIHETAGQRSRPSTNSDGKYFIFGKNRAAVIFAESGPEQLQIPIVGYTSAGIELLSLLPPHDENSVLAAIANFIKSNVPSARVGIIGDGFVDAQNGGVHPPFTFLWGDEAALIPPPHSGAERSTSR